MIKSKSLLISTILSIALSLLEANSFFEIPNWYYIDVGDTKIIYEEKFEYRAKLIATFIDYLNNNTESLHDYLKDGYIVIDKESVANNLDFNFNKFIDSYIYKNKRTQVTYDEIELSNISNLVDIPLTINSRELRKSVLQLTYNISRGKSLKSTKSIIYPEWFHSSKEEYNEAILESFRRRLELQTYDSYRDFALYNKYIPYQNLVNGSYRNKTPNLTDFGILASNYFLQRYGPERWQAIVNDIEYFEYFFYPYSRSFKKNTDITIEEFYNDFHNFYKRQFLHDINLLPPDLSSPYYAQNQQYNNSITQAFLLNNGNIIAVKESYKHPKQVIQISEDSIEKVVSIGYMNDIEIDVNEPYILWNEKHKELNLNNIENSSLVFYNLQNRKKRIIKTNEIFVKPKMSPDKSKIATIRISDKYSQNITILDFDTGDRIYYIPNNNCWSFNKITWLDQYTIVYIAENFLGQTAIVKYNISTKKEQVLTPFSTDPIKDLHVSDSAIYFTYPINDIYNVCYLSQNDSLAYQTFYSDNSVCYPYIKGDTLIYTANKYWGKELRIIQLDKNSFTPTMWNKNEMLVDDCSIIIDNLKKYYKGEKQLDPMFELIRFRALRLQYDQREANIYTYSRNPMKTFTINATSKLSFKNLGMKTSLSSLFSSFYPNIRTEISHSNSRHSNDNHEEIMYGVSLILPLNFIEGSNNGNMNYSLGLNHLDRYRSKSIFNFTERADLTFNYINTSLSLTSLAPKAQNDFYSPLGQYYSINYKKSVDEIDAEQITIQADFSFDSFWENYSFLLENSFVNEDSQNEYRFSDNLTKAYGYFDDLEFDRQVNTKLKMYTSLFYPEVGIKDTVYLKRIYASPFICYSNSVRDSNDNKTKIERNSAGTEILLDYKLFNEIELKLGLRYSFLFNRSNDRHQIEFIIPVSKF